jgi:hypothetical protein
MSGPRRLVYLLVAAFVCASAPAQDAAIVPLTVCEILHDLASYEGKPVAALGRYSFRHDGSWLGEQACDAVPSSPTPPALLLAEDPVDGPRPPESFQLDGAAVTRKLTEMRKHTSLGKFRFGSTDYDRWAVVFGRVENRKDAAAKKAAADLVFRGDGVVVFINP